MRNLTDKKVRVEFVKEQPAFTGDDSPDGESTVERDGRVRRIRARPHPGERQGEGIAKAKERGAYKGRKKSLRRGQDRRPHQPRRRREAKTVLAKEFGISRETVYAYLRAAPD